ncbi:MAG TPA: hypothetical protein VFE16_06605 [Candidatus Cybelea sp.]|nr:hypothetical protein [Candidatus Cybelea sp.]
MKLSFILAAIVSFGVWVAPHTAIAQATDQTSAPMATATVNPDATMNPNADNSTGAATATPGAETYTQTTTSGGGHTGWWGLIGLVGLLGLFGGRGRGTTTITGP